MRSSTHNNRAIQSAMTAYNTILLHERIVLWQTCVLPPDEEWKSKIKVNGNTIEVTEYILV